MVLLDASSRQRLLERRVKAPVPPHNKSSSPGALAVAILQRAVRAPVLESDTEPSSQAQHQLHLHARTGDDHQANLQQGDNGAGGERKCCSECRVPPAFQLVSADHMTICYKPDQAHLDGLPIGRTVRLAAVGIARDDKRQASPPDVPFILVDVSCVRVCDPSLLQCTCSTLHTQ